MNNVQFGIFRAIWLALTLCVCLFARQGVTIDSGKARPVHVAVRALEQKFGWRICYEDPPYATNESTNVIPGVAFVVPIAKPIRFSFDQPRDLLSGEKARVVGQILQQHAQLGNPGAFAAIHNGDFTHIVPIARTDETGAIIPYASLLSTHVNFAATQMSVQQIVEVVLGQVSAARNIPVELGSIPTSLFHEQQTRGASDDTAEDVLVKSFELANHIGQSSGATPRRVAWDLLYDPDGKRFFFNAHLVSSSGAGRGTANRTRLAQGNGAMR
jgi:hypothetical protein